MNKINLINGEYILTVEDGQNFICKRFFEKKTDTWHVQIPKEAVEICGRKFVREKFFEATGSYEFENKTEHRSGIGNGGWRSRLTAEEAAELESHEQAIEAIKKMAMDRKPEKTDPNSIEGLEKRIAELEAKKARLLAK